MAHPALRIWEAAARAGVSIDTVRFYERRKLLPRAPRTGGGFGLFRPEALERIRFIKQAQEIGLSLGEIGELLAEGARPNAKEFGTSCAPSLKRWTRRSRPCAPSVAPSPVTTRRVKKN